MASKTSRVVPVRIPNVLITEIENAIASADVFRFEQPYTVSEWIRGAIAEKIGHLRRSKAQRKGKRKGVKDEV